MVVGGTGRIICDGARSCADGDYTSNNIFTVRAALGTQNSILRAGDNSVSYTFGAHEAAEGAEIICDNTCSITCYSTGCNGLTLTCVTGPGTCNFNIYCNSGAKSSICPNGYELPSSFILPSLVNREFTTLSNIRTCF